MGKRRGRQRSDREVTLKNDNITKKAAVAPLNSNAALPTSSVDVDLLGYLRSAENMLFESVSDDEKHGILSSIFQEIGHSFWSIAMDQEGSTILESVLINAASNSSFDDNIISFLKDVQGTILDYCLHPFASHVVQSVFIVASKRISATLRTG